VYLRRCTFLRWPGLRHVAITLPVSGAGREIRPHDIL
jgi:hypothetical protein